jgi:hypothetical protein
MFNLWYILINLALNIQHTQGVLQLYVITEEGDFLGLCDEKSPILDCYRVITVWNLEWKVTIIDNKRNKIIN